MLKIFSLTFFQYRIILDRLDFFLANYQLFQSLSIWISVKTLRNLIWSHYAIKEEELHFSVLCFKHVIGKKKASKMRIMAKQSGIELAHLKVVTYPGLAIQSLLLVQQRENWLQCIICTKFDPCSLNKYSILAHPW